MKNITKVPPVAVATAMLPKAMFTFFTKLIGVMMVADADAVAVAWANELLDNPKATTAMASTFVMFFICLFFFKVEIVCVCLLIGI